MIEKQINYRVIYGDTDKMGVVYYANYLRFYEAGRSEYMRSLGFPYTLLEETGIVCPAIEVKMKYHQSAFFDDLLIVVTVLKDLPGASMVFQQKTLRDGMLLNEAEIMLCFLDTNRHKPVRCPNILLDYLKNIGY